MTQLRRQSENVILASLGVRLAARPENYISLKNTTNAANFAKTLHLEANTRIESATLEHWCSDDENIDVIFLTESVGASHKVSQLSLHK